MLKFKKLNFIDHSLFFIMLIWLSSRVLIAFTMLIIAPLFPVASNGVPSLSFSINQLSIISVNLNVKNEEETQQIVPLRSCLTTLKS